MHGRPCQSVGGTHLDDPQMISVLAVGAARLFEHTPHVRPRLGCLGDGGCVCMLVCGVEGKVGEGDGAGGGQVIGVGHGGWEKE